MDETVQPSAQSAQSGQSAQTHQPPQTIQTSQTVRRFSSRREPLDHCYLRDRLKGAVSYDRIAGYFRSSVFEVAGEDIEAVVGKVRVICNGDLNPNDITTARAARDAVTRKWMETPANMDSVLNGTRYQRLYDLLTSGKVEVRVLARGTGPFLHGKAGAIRHADGTGVAFMGSVNETAEGWRDNYELLWEDTSEEAVRWVEDEFNALWDKGIPLPDAVVTEIQRMSKRSEYGSIKEWQAQVMANGEGSLAAAAVVESPVYRAGECLYPWQRQFVSMVLKHRMMHGKARLLLADEVGLGKTMSLGAAAMMTVLMEDGPVLLLVPATLTLQWQAELWDRLGLPSAVWAREKCWVDHKGRQVTKVGDPEGVTECPCAIGIVSTGMVVHVNREGESTRERELLLQRRYGCVILDEAHKARRNEQDNRDAKCGGNRLLEFMRDIAPRTVNLLLGTATPIQVDPIELWDLVEVLGRGAEHVLGDARSIWRTNPALTLDYVLERKPLPVDILLRFNLVSNPLAPPGERPAALFSAIRSDLGLAEDAVSAHNKFTRIGSATRSALDADFEGAIRHSNPLVRHTVLRKRKIVEDMRDPHTGEKLMREVHVTAHPPTELTDRDFLQGAVRMTPDLRDAYEAATEFCLLIGKRVKGAGFLKTILLRRVGSSVCAGLSTAQRILAHKDEKEKEKEKEKGREKDGKDETDEREDYGDLTPTDEARDEVRRLTDGERVVLERVVRCLEVLAAKKDGDPKGRMVARYLSGLGEGGMGWLEYGSIIFSQYYDSAEWLAGYLATLFPSERIGLYGGNGRSRVLHGGMTVKAERDAIKTEVSRGSIRLLVATDAACEGLNLQALGTLVNLDLPWNPAKLEQRKGRIQRIGQLRDTVDVLNLRYADSVEDNVFHALSARFQNIWDMFGQFPDVLEDDWTKAILTGRDEASKFIHDVPKQNHFDLRYRSFVSTDDWDGCAKVLAQEDILTAMSKGWQDVRR